MTSDIGAPSDDYCITCPRGYFCNFESMMLLAVEHTYAEDTDGNDVSTSTVHHESIGDYSSGTDYSVNTKVKGSD
jgi:hypothetical protein